MEKLIERKELILLLDTFSQEAKDLYTSFQLSQNKYLTIVIEEDGFLPDGVISLYGFFLGDFEKEKTLPQKPRFFNQITVPEFWEIRGTNSNGSIYNKDKERGKIFYTEPKHKRMVKVIDWYDERGVVRSSDHYNRYGALYGRTIFNAKGQRVNRTYFSPQGKEVIVENYVTGNIILNHEGKVIIFNSKVDMAVYLLNKIEAADSRICFNSLSTSFFVSQRLEGRHKRDILFWQERERPDIPGNMQVILERKANRTETIIVQKEKAYTKLLQLGAAKEMIFKLGQIYPFKRENLGRRQALICTNSDRMENLIKLVNTMEEVHFHIAALTEMSSRLMSMGAYENVSLYPGVKDKTLEELFELCDFYLDINYENEIVMALRRAFLQNQLIFAFEETVHNREIIAGEHIFTTNDTDKMIECIRKILSNEGIRKEHVLLQQKAAMAEDTDSYLKII